jgi:hypothetical protein
MPIARIEPRGLEAIPQICAGGPEARPTGKLSARERFQWQVAPRSTVIQFRPVHAAFGEDAASELSDFLAPGGDEEVTTEHSTANGICPHSSHAE